MVSFGGDRNDGGAFKAGGNFTQLQGSIEDVGENGRQLISMDFEAGGEYSVWSRCSSGFCFSLCILNSRGEGKDIRLRY